MSEVFYIASIAFFVFVVIFQQIFFAYQLNKLLNKFMSRNYGEYTQSQSLAKAANQPIQGPLGAQDYTNLRPEEHLEDLRVLEGLQIR
jgi:hypothetical protein